MLGTTTHYNFVTNAEDEPKEDDKETAMNKLKSAKRALLKMIKLIRSADKSKAGWDTVNEYISDDLASDSDDDKRIRKVKMQLSRSEKKASAARS